MMNGTSTTYQPAVAYQGGQVNTPQQDPKNGQTQPIQAPAADSQGSDQQSSQGSSSQGRGGIVDVHA
jgi:hypothetical protein